MFISVAVMGHLANCYGKNASFIVLKFRKKNYTYHVTYQVQPHLIQKPETGTR